MFTKFEVITISESEAGYRIPDKKFRGFIDGLVCGWQFEYKGDDGKLYYGSTVFESCTPETYANRYSTDSGLSWLEEYVAHNGRLTGRVVFRGYAVTRWDPEERDEYVVDVEVADDGSMRFVMLESNYQLLLKSLRGYDPFTDYIDNGRQQAEAERSNSERVKTVENIIHSMVYGDITFPYHLTNLPAEEFEPKVKKWLLELNIVVEEKLEDNKPEPPKPTKRVWTEDEIKNLVQTNDKVLYGALKNLYDCQTYDEKTNEKTSHANGAGFNAMDAKVLTSIAEFLLKNGFLTEKQKELVRKKLVKYNRQLTRLANA